jgi:hypothetical protein
MPLPSKTLPQCLKNSQNYKKKLRENLQQGWILTGSGKRHSRAPANKEYIFGMALLMFCMLFIYGPTDDVGKTTR